MEEYERMFGQWIPLPFGGDWDKFLDEMERAIETGEPMDVEKWHPSDPNVIV